MFAGRAQHEEDFFIVAHLRIDARNLLLSRDELYRLFIVNVATSQVNGAVQFEMVDRIHVEKVSIAPKVSSFLTRDL